VSGLGLHTGAETEATFLPAPPGQGIVFRRTDLTGTPVVPARLTEVEAVERRTAIGKGRTTIHTVEHLLAAVAARDRRPHRRADGPRAADPGWQCPAVL